MTAEPWWPFDPIAPMTCDVVLADPPWNFKLRTQKGEKKSAQAHYPCMDLEAIKALPVARLCRGAGLCWMWTTWPFVASGGARETMVSWGFRPVTGGAWFKRTKHDKPAFGTGYVLRSACEPFLIGTIGGPLLGKDVRNIIETVEDGNALVALAREHSRKPDLQYEMIERMCPRALHGVELFARQRHVGGKISWTPWGNDVDHFTPP